MLWHSRSKLSWDDFNVVDNLDEPHLKAISFVSIRSHEGFVGDSLEIDVSCYFDSERSSVERDAMTDDLLRHEQGHFDLGEIYARKLKAEYKKLKYTRDNFKKLNGVAEIKSIYNRIYNELQTAQFEYDRNTDHGTKDAAQSTWNKKILEALKTSEH